MKKELQNKLDLLEKSGKLTAEQRKEIEDAIESAIQSEKSLNFTSSTESIQSDELDESNSPTSDNLCETEIPWNNRKVSIRLIDEDVLVEGKPEIQSLHILQGKEYIQMMKNEEEIRIVSKKTQNKTSFFQFQKTQLVHVQVPVQSIVKIKTVSGDTEIRDIDNKVSLKSVSGDIKASSIKGKLETSVISGDILIATCSNIDEAVTKNGDISISNSQIKGDVKAYSGDLTLHNIQVTDSDLSTFSGDLLATKMSPLKEVYLKTFSGDINAELLSAGGTICTTSAKKTHSFTDSSNQKVFFTDSPVSFGNGKDTQIEVKTRSGDCTLKIKELEQ